MRKIYQTVKSGKCHFRVKMMAKDLGECFSRGAGRSTITINLIDCVAPVLIHECLHHLYPDKSEETILKMENHYMKKLATPRQRRHLIKLFLRRVYEKR